MKVLFYILLAFPFFAFGQGAEIQLYNSYSFTDGHVSYRLDLFENGTFSYEHSFSRGSTSSKGNWKLTDDTLKLEYYNKPWSILSVDEKRIDTIKDKITVKVVLPDDDTSIVSRFGIWINNNCQTIKRTDDMGTVEFDTKSVASLSVDYGEYIISDHAANYFLITISGFPIFLSPPILGWTKWKVGKHVINPIECGKVLDYITLK